MNKVWPCWASVSDWYTKDRGPLAGKTGLSRTPPEVLSPVLLASTIPPGPFGYLYQTKTFLSLKLTQSQRFELEYDLARAANREASRVSRMVASRSV